MSQNSSQIKIQNYKTGKSKISYTVYLEQKHCMYSGVLSYITFSKCSPSCSSTEDNGQAYCTLQRAAFAGIFGKAEAIIWKFQIWNHFNAISLVSNKTPLIILQREPRIVAEKRPLLGARATYNLAGIFGHPVYTSP